ncbi:hypothetical protein SAMN05444156_2868 [Verrucomicrobium sp. GAS474]|uniref:hypothetical protein n=1 Tax=Verrucomicrobium sp. GAS474 TaxID=1882831 RepID=UPI00087D95E8|nr:hypothetical protein [Verrucomicrobium sp. GAS474]SDU25202.1 hypothetical protein SAMN05444156_2868 [Verrucomicrobium sp. GAS474]
MSAKPILSSVAAAPAPLLHDRMQRAARIVGAPGNYKVCEGCESILSKNVSLCPTCRGYRFDSDYARVITHANVLATRVPVSILWED